MTGKLSPGMQKCIEAGMTEGNREYNEAIREMVETVTVSLARCRDRTELQQLRMQPRRQRICLMTDLPQPPRVGDYCSGLGSGVDNCKGRLASDHPSVPSGYHTTWV